MLSRMLTGLAVLLVSWFVVSLIGMTLVNDKPKYNLVLEDANNLAKTGITYMVLFFLGSFLKWPVVGIVIGIVMIILAVRPVLSCIKMMLVYHDRASIAALISQAAPMALGIMVILYRL